MSLDVQINGAKGLYDDKVADKSIRYGRNAVENHISYMEAPIVNNSMKLAPILDFSFSEQAQDANIEALEAFVEDNDKYLESLPPLEY